MNVFSKHGENRQMEGVEIKNVIHTVWCVAAHSDWVWVLRETVGGPFHRWRPPVGTPIMSVSANGEQYTQSRQKRLRIGSVKQGQGFKELPISQTATSTGANYCRKRRDTQRQMPLLNRDAHLERMNAKPAGPACWKSACYLNPVFSPLCLVFVSLMQVHSHSPNLPWPLHTHLSKSEENALPPIYCLLIEMLVGFLPRFL